MNHSNHRNHSIHSNHSNHCHKWRPHPSVMAQIRQPSRLHGTILGGLRWCSTSWRSSRRSTATGRPMAGFCWAWLSVVAGLDALSSNNSVCCYIVTTTIITYNRSVVVGGVAYWHMLAYAYIILHTWYILPHTYMHTGMHTCIHTYMHTSVVTLVGLLLPIVTVVVKRRVRGLPYYPERTPVCLWIICHSILGLLAEATSWSKLDQLVSQAGG